MSLKSYSFYPFQLYDTHLLFNSSFPSPISQTIDENDKKTVDRFIIPLPLIEDHVTDVKHTLLSQ